MNYKEMFYFISRCLTISHENKNKFIIEKKLQLNKIDWEIFVSISTSHYVLPALYCNFRRVGFLHYLPKDLVIYMQEITKINENRNHQIIKQVKEINTLLSVNNITPIFLKGAGNLLIGLYEDISERMIGDIDFIISKDSYQKTINILKNNGYQKVLVNGPELPSFKHYNRLTKENYISAVEIHKELIVEKYSSEFNYEFIIKDCQIINGFSVLSNANKLNLSIIAHQIEDNGFHFKNISLRNAYDVFLISKKINARAAIDTLNSLNHKLNCFLAICYVIFNNVSSLEYNKSNKTSSYIADFEKQFLDRKKTIKKTSRVKIILSIKNKIYILYKSILFKEYRDYLVKKIMKKIGSKKS